MRRITMKGVIAQVDHGELPLGPPNDRATALAVELEHRLRDVIVAFVRDHESEMEPTTVCTAMLGAVAVQAMALFELGVDDFAELARAAARLSIPEVEELRAALRRAEDAS